MQLIQKSFFKGFQSFEMSSDSLIMKYKKRTQTRREEIPLNQINPSYFEATNPKLGLLIFSIATLTIFLLSLYGLITTDDLSISSVYLYMMMMAGAFCPLSFYKYKAEGLDVTYFSHIYSGQPVALIWNNFPNKAESGNFVAALKQSIINSNNKLLNDGSLVSEIMKLKSLLEGGVINHQEFEAGKKLLLGTDISEQEYN